MARNGNISASEVFRAVMTTTVTDSEGNVTATRETAVYGPYDSPKGARQAATRNSGQTVGAFETVTVTGRIEAASSNWQPLGAFEDAKQRRAEKAAEAAGPQFTPWPKTPRLFRGMTVTEKIDGTNAAVHIVENADAPGTYAVTAQSRNRIITPGKATDNYGFAAWVRENAAELAELLGAGLHFGEFWGQGIGRNYGSEGRSFSLFNTDKHADVSAVVGGVEVAPVPVLYRGEFSTQAVANCVAFLKSEGSFAVPGFDKPEGVCVFHHASRQVFKVTLDGNDAGKWEAMSA